MVNEIKNNIIGPRSNDEKINFNPKNEYFAGILFPGDWEVDEEDKESDVSVDSGDDESGTSQISKDKLYKQSSFGLTCLLKKETKKINVKIQFGKYNQSEEKYHFERTHYEENDFPPISVEISKGTFDFSHDPKFQLHYQIFEKSDSFLLNVYVVNNHKMVDRNSLKEIMFQPEIILSSPDTDYCFMADHDESDDRFDSKGDKHLKLLLYNKISFGKGHLCAVTWKRENVKDRTINEISTTFLPIEESVPIKPRNIKKDYLNMNKITNCNTVQELQKILLPLVSDYDEWLTNLEDHELKNISSLYDDSAKTKITEIRDEVIPRIREGIESVTSDSDLNAFDSFKFANSAIAWQQTMKKWADKNMVINDEIKQLKYKQKRIEKNQKLSDNEKKSETDLIESQIKDLKLEKTPEPTSPSDDVEWRLFQIAFILLNLESIINLKSKYRESVDLLWFPTGGGKTEAYLGLVAFTIAYRRLRGKIDDNFSEKSFGVTVLMRYTLRLLTVQQFQRAALLMCACEKIRRSDQGKWGSENPFQVGLWVGGAVTPNKRDKGSFSALSKKYSLLDSKKRITTITENNPYTLINCPWCGNDLSVHNGDVTGAPKQWRLFCSRGACMFSQKDGGSDDNSLPVVVVDEDVYSRCPSLVISTADKFAQITWKPECKSIFGQIENFCKYCGYYQTNSQSKHTHPEEKNKKKPWLVSHPPLSPPELIIQDELHLISGQLGTTFGLYETGLEHLMTNDGIKPKIIASTATTRASEDQIRKLFNRNKTSIFPPQVIEFGDTFFSEIKINDDSSKMYLGVLATNKSGLTVQAKISATILYNVKKLIEFGVSPKKLDPYYTLVSYYNSQKDLGGSSISFKDSVPKFVSVIENQSNNLTFHDSSNPTLSIEKKKIDPNLEKKLRKRYWDLNTSELTSRKPSGEIPEILRELNLESTKTDYPVDVLLATNMLSVGVDIPRLGVMLVNGQPKKHSEYIQATGRIGRSKPGLIITLYAYTKPRDISHYEDFISYHSRFYQNVERVSLTPFTLPSRQMGLFAIMVGLMRIKSKKLSENIDSGKFVPTDATQKVIIEEIKKIFEDRVENIDHIESKNTQNHIDRLFEEWELYTRLYKGHLKYSESTFDKTNKNLSDLFYYLLKNDLSSKKQLIFAPTSFRDTESALNLFYEKMEIRHE
jgi:superfamily II DNA/RNA helicase